ncbi:MAG TPA: amino acid ABC transporter permease [Actinomycetota bacterium]
MADVDEQRLQTIAAQEGPPVEVAPHARPSTPREWLRENLFSTWRNGLVTVVTALVVGWALYQILRWIFVTGDFQVVKANLASYMLARFPREEVWRVWTSLYLVLALAGLSWGYSERHIAWTRRRMVEATVLVLGGILVLVYLLDTVLIWMLITGAVAALLVPMAAGRLLAHRYRRPLRRVVIAGWILIYPAILAILLLFDGPSSRAWGGVLLNVMAGSVAIVASFPIGILLALGRRSSFPAIRTFCVGVIELIRGVPLITLLISGVFILPLLLPPQLQMPTVMRVIVMLTVFSAVYVAEIVRGGLQGVHHGQYEAARALGLSTTRMTALVILPQALRNTIPALISHFISLWKDTSLLAIVAGLTDLLAAARRSAAGLEFIGDSKEALLGAAFIFWAVAFTASRWSQRLERRVGVGER